MIEEARVHVNGRRDVVHDHPEIVLAEDHFRVGVADNLRAAI
jgi:hypothetical protein